MSNIFEPISAWAGSTSYSVGNTRSNGGNGYRCITAGVSASSGGPSGTGSNITDGAAHWKYLAHIDYTTVQSWWNAIPTSMAAPALGEMWDCGLITTVWGTEWLSASGKTSSSSNTITLRAAAGESIRDIVGAGGALAFNATSGVRIRVGSGSGGGGGVSVIFVDNQPYFFIEGLMIQDTGASSNKTIIGTSATNSANFRIRDCVIDGYSQSGAIMLTIADPDFAIENCLIIDRQASGDANPTLFFFAAPRSLIINTTFVSINGNINGSALAINNCQPPDQWLTVTNSSILNYNTGSITDFSNQFQVDHSLTDASSFDGGSSSIIDNGNNIVSAVFVNEVVNTTTDFRLKSGAQSVNAGTDASTYITTADDISRKSRPQGIAWDIGPYEAGASYTKAVALATTQARLVVKGDSRKSSATTTQHAVVATTKALSANKSVSAASPEHGSLAKSLGHPISVASGYVTAVAEKFFRVGVVATTMSYVARTRRNPGVSENVASAEVVYLARGLPKARGATTPQIAGTKRQLGHLVSAVTTYVAAIRRAQSRGISAVQTQSPSTFSSKVRGKVLAAAQAMTSAIATGQFKGRSLSAVDAQSASMQRVLSLHLARSLSSPQTPSAVALKARIFALSASQQYAARFTTSFGHVVSIAIAESVSVLRAETRKLSLAMTEAAASIKTVGIPRGIAAAQTVSRRISQNKPISVISTNAVSVLRAVSSSVHAAQTQVAAFTVSRGMAKAYSAASASAAHVGRGVFRTLQAAMQGAQTIFWSIGKGVSASTSDRAGAIPGRVLNFSLTAGMPEVAGVRRMLGHVSSGFQTMALAVSRVLGHSFMATNPEAISYRRGISIQRGARSPGAVVAARQFIVRLAASTAEVAGNLASRAMNLGARTPIVASFVSWYHFFVAPEALQNGVLLPSAGGPAEPPAFSAMDPADEMTFTFDWSVRTEAGDRIATAAVACVPPGLNFIGPAMISTDGMRVDVTIGPSPQINLPTVYGLRCTAVFVSGRRSSYTIALPVQTL